MDPINCSNQVKLTQLIPSKFVPFCELLEIGELAHAGLKMALLLLRKDIMKSNEIS